MKLRITVREDREEMIARIKRMFGLRLTDWEKFLIKTSPKRS